MAGRPTSDDSKKIGARMKQIMRQKQITQEHAAYKLGLGSQAVLNNYINGRSEIPLNIINNFCAEFGVPVATLFGTDDIVINAENDLVLDIMLAIDEFLAENHLELSGEQRKDLAKDFLAKDCKDASRIKDTLSALRVLKSDLFLKRK